jgi:hypothetical protein
MDQAHSRECQTSPIVGAIMVQQARVYILLFLAAVLGLGLPVSVALADQPSVEEAREAFLQEFSKAPAIEIVTLIARQMQGNTAKTANHLQHHDPWDHSNDPQNAKGSDLLGVGVMKLLTFEKTNGYQGMLMGRTVYTVLYRAEFEVNETFTLGILKQTTQGMKNYRIVKLSDKPEIKSMKGIQLITQGTKFNIEGEILLLLTEKGWISDFDSAIRTKSQLILY